MRWRRPALATLLVLPALLTGCDLLTACLQPVASLSRPTFGSDGARPSQCADLYEANGQTWYATPVVLTAAAMDAIQPAGRLERAVNPERIDDPTLYALPGVDPALALVRHRDDGAADAFDLLYPQETQPTTAVCPFLTPPDPRESESGGALPTVSPPSPASKPPSEILNGYEFVCGGAA